MVCYEICRHLPDDWRYSKTARSPGVRNFQNNDPELSAPLAVTASKIHTKRVMDIVSVDRSWRWGVYEN